MSDMLPPQVTPPAASSASPVGKVRSPLSVILLSIITLGIYTLFWYYAVHNEMKANTGDGIGGAIALVIAIFVSPVMAFLTPHEVGAMYAKDGASAPTSWKTGFWVFLPIVGAIIWVYKVQTALNNRWTAAAA